MKNLFSCLILLLLVSCEAQTAFEIKDENGVTGIRHEADGSFFANNELLGKITADGTVTDNDGTIIAQIGDDNILTNANGESLLKIDENGRMDNGSGMFMEWSENGELMQGGTTTGMKMSPVNKNSFRNASILMFLFLSVSDS